MKEINRRDFCESAGKVGAGLVLLGLSRKGFSSNRPPNIILIVADDLGWKELGCCGNQDIHTPNLDRLAEQGVRFSNAFVTAPSCSPCRSSIVTGQAPHSVGVLGLTHIHKYFSLSTQETTYPKLLQKAGYVTAQQGKRHLAGNFTSLKPYGYEKVLGSYEPMIFSSKKACSFLDKNRHRPFYLELDFFDTHRLAAIPFGQVREFPVDPEKIHVPEYWALPDLPEIRDDAAGYYSHAANMDRKIGEVLDHLDRLGLSDNTLVCFVSDNGPPFPGAKMMLYDRGVGTPLIMRWPKKIKAGMTREELVSVIDIMPTFLEAAGIPVPEDVQGLSLLPLTRGERPAWRDAIFTEMTWHVDYHPMRSVRTDEWKYIWNLSNDPVPLDQCDFEWFRRLAKAPGYPFGKPRPAEELYHLAEDRDEQKNLSDDPTFLSKKQELKNSLIKWMKNTNDPYAFNR
jgi:N-sulfoglucosamine sulfohydrolase